MTSTNIFEGIAAVSQFGMAIAVAIGVAVAYLQLGQWKSESKAKRTAEIAEDLIARATGAAEALDLIRNPMEQVPADQDRRLFVFDQKMERIQKFMPQFDELRQSQILARAVIGNQHADEAVSELFAIRQEVYAAISTLRATHRQDGEPDIDLDFAMQLDMKIYATKGRRDELSPRQNAAVQTIERELYPLVRMET